MYRWLRLNGGSYSREDYNPQLSDAQDCAILSYDNHDSEFSGWINRQRYMKWRYRAHTLQLLGELSF